MHQPPFVTLFVEVHILIFDMCAISSLLLYSQVKFFVSGAVFQQAQHLVASYGIEGATFVAMDAEDTEYPPVRRNLAMLMEAAAMMEQYTWLLKVDDDTYVDTTRLQRLLTRELKNISSEPHFLGARGFGREKDVPFLDLPESGTGFCMGGPGYLLTKKAMMLVMPHLHSCGDYFSKHEHRDYLWHSDVVISKCVTKWTGLGCWDSGVAKSKPYSQGSVFRQYYPSSTNVVRYDSVTFHPLKTKEGMISYHEEKNRRKSQWNKKSGKRNQRTRNRKTMT